MWIKTQWGTLENTDKFETIAVVNDNDGKFRLCGLDKRGGEDYLGEYRTEEEAKSAMDYIFGHLRVNDFAIELEVAEVLRKMREGKE